MQLPWSKASWPALANRPAPLPDGLVRGGPLAGCHTVMRRAMTETSPSPSKVIRCSAELHKETSALIETAKEVALETQELLTGRVGRAHGRSRRGATH